MEQLTRRNFAAGMALGTVATGAALASQASNAHAIDASDAACGWLEGEIEIDESQIVDTIDCEVLVCGAGTGGMYAAAFLADMGVKPLVIEKMSTNSGPTLDIGAFNSRFMDEHGDHMDPASTLWQLVNYSAGRADTRLLKLWMDRSAEAIEALDELLKKHEVGYVYHTGSYDKMNAWEESSTSTYGYPKNPTGHHVASSIEDMRGGDIMRKIVEDNGGQIMYWTSLVKIERDGQNVTGVIALNEEEKYIRINADKGVIVATGGYQGNPQMFEELQPDTAIIVPRVSPTNSSGDGHKACLWLGACMDDVHTSMLFDRRAILPGESAPDNVTSDYTSSKLGSQPFLKLNCFGDRFCNESQPYDYSLHMMANWPEHFFVDVFDSDFAKYIVQFEQVGCSRYFPFPSDYEDYAAEHDAIVDYVQNRVANELEKLGEGGFVVSADTIEELAEKAQLPVENVVAAVARYNELCGQGEDVDFYKEAYRLTPVVNPPFYAVRFTGRMLTTMDGVRTDVCLRPTNKQGVPFENLYVTGNVSGGFFANMYPNHFTGLAGGRTLTWSWLIANQIATL